MNRRLLKLPVFVRNGSVNSRKTTRNRHPNLIRRSNISTTHLLRIKSTLSRSTATHTITSHYTSHNQNKRSRHTQTYSRRRNRHTPRITNSRRHSNQSSRQNKGRTTKRILTRHLSKYPIRLDLFSPTGSTASNNLITCHINTRRRTSTRRSQANIRTHSSRSTSQRIFPNSHKLVSSHFTISRLAISQCHSILISRRLIASLRNISQSLSFNNHIKTYEEVNRTRPNHILITTRRLQSNPPNPPRHRVLRMLASIRRPRSNRYSRILTRSRTYRHHHKSRNVNTNLSKTRQTRHTARRQVPNRGNSANNRHPPNNSRRQ